MLYTLISLIILALGSIPLLSAINRNGRENNEDNRRRVRRGAMISAITVAFLILLHLFFYYFTEFLWFEAVKYTARFWTIFITKILLFVCGFVFASLFLIWNVHISLRRYRQLLTMRNFFNIAILIGLAMGIYAVPEWNKLLLFLGRGASPIREPVFNMTTGFYLFSLPFYSYWINWLIILIVLSMAMIVTIGSVTAAERFADNEPEKIRNIRFPSGQLLFSTGLVLLLLTVNSLLDRYRLMYSTLGVVYGAGFTDIYWRNLGYWVSAIILYIFGVTCIIGAIFPAVRHRIFGFGIDSKRSWRPGRTLWTAGSAFVIIILFRWIIPLIVQAIVVSPNELALEKPFLKNNILFTQQGFRVDSASIDRRFYAVRSIFDDSVLQYNVKTLYNIRLWDPRALRANLKQQQEIRLYYVFNDIDIGRYLFDDTTYREVMLSVRELNQADLNPRSKTWLSLHQIYTHGMGIDMLPVNDFLPGGQPNLLIKDIPPLSLVPRLDIKQPRIYYGELTNSYVFAPTREPEFDYPAGDTNSYNFYTGSGGVPLDNYFKRFSFGWRLGDYQILFSTNPTRNTKILIFRDIKSRVRKILPFLKLDRDPYAFITDDGRIKYVYDAYTYSNRYPYSQPYTETILNYEFGNMEYQHLMPDYEEFIYNYLGVNYLRNAVKVFIDAQDGTVENYIVDTTDEIIRAYDRMFPGLFKPLEDMPEDYRRHIRYPEDFLTVQAHVYSIYHMSDPTVFYQREDVWQFPTEKYRENYQTLQPYFVMLRLPEDDHLKYMLMLPFTPQNRNVMNAWMAGQCDFPDYGKIIVYQFPKGQEVYGPQQIEALIDQNTEISASVTLWGQSGSRVIRGNLLTIPLFLKDQLYMIYVEPLFLQAENAEIPEIKRIVTGDQNGVVWDSTLEGSLLKLMFKDTSVVNP